MNTTEQNPSVIIPTFNAGAEIGDLLQALLYQTLPPREIVVVDSSSDDGTAGVVRAFADQGVTLETIDRASFDHGGTRRMAVERTSGEFFVALTQDAVLTDIFLLERLLAPFADSSVAASSGRQVAKPDARPFEKLVREYRYPSDSWVRSRSDMARYGMSVLSISDVCCAYRRDPYERCGGFPKRCKTNEDMYMAAKFVELGYRIAYAADASILHSHNLSPSQQYRRNRDIGFFLEANADLLGCPSEVGEGRRLVCNVSGELLREGHVGELCAFGVDCAARFLGNRAGHRAARGALGGGEVTVTEAKRQAQGRLGKMEDGIRE